MIQIKALHMMKMCCKCISDVYWLENGTNNTSNNYKYYNNVNRLILAFFLVTSCISSFLRVNDLELLNCPYGTVDAKTSYVLGLPVHDKVVVVFGRKVFLVDCL